MRPFPPPRPPVITPATVDQWRHDITDFRMEFIAAVADELDRHQTAAALATALQTLLTEKLSLLSEPHEVALSPDGGVCAANPETGDGATFFRDGDRWWVIDPSWPKPADAREQHLLAAEEAIWREWWGNDDEVARAAGAILFPPVLADPDVDLGPL